MQDTVLKHSSCCVSGVYEKTLCGTVTSSLFPSHVHLCVCESSCVCVCVRCARECISSELPEMCVCDESQPCLLCYSPQEDVLDCS